LTTIIFGAFSEEGLGWIGPHDRWFPVPAVMLAGLCIFASAGGRSSSNFFDMDFLRPVVACMQDAVW